jgi:transcriptional regulator GlxA family with amidase domain
LSAIFKKKTGQTPGRFRAESRIADAADKLPRTDSKGRI